MVVVVVVVVAVGMMMGVAWPGVTGVRIMTGILIIAGVPITMV